jgi:hypothetical protein
MSGAISVSLRYYHSSVLGNSPTLPSNRPQDLFLGELETPSLLLLERGLPTEAATHFISPALLTSVHVVFLSVLTMLEVSK